MAKKTFKGVWNHSRLGTAWGRTVAHWPSRCRFHVLVSKWSRALSPAWRRQDKSFHSKCGSPLAATVKPTHRSEATVAWRACLCATVSAAATGRRPRVRVGTRGEDPRGSPKQRRRRVIGPARAREPGRAGWEARGGAGRRLRRPGRERADSAQQDVSARRGAASALVAGTRGAA